MKDKKQLKLAAVIEGSGWNHSSWRHPAIPADASENIDFYVHQARLAEEAKFESLFLIDVSHVGPGNFPNYLSMFEGGTLMSALAMKTERIGLSLTASTSYADPYNLARQVLSLDKISRGRASLNAITSNPGGMVNFSRGHLGKADQYPMHKEFLEILLGLWDTYEDDALPRNKETGVFLDPRKMHRVNYRGQYFSVEGPLNLSRSVQGRPVLYTAGNSATFVETASSYTDGAFLLGINLEDSVRTVQALHQKLRDKGRRPENFVCGISHPPWWAAPTTRPWKSTANWRPLRRATGYHRPPLLARPNAWPTRFSSGMRPGPWICSWCARTTPTACTTSSNWWYPFCRRGASSTPTTRPTPCAAT
jgi:alkanesulfonate monooxygenase SsuD/methylene tetrahydromethanopterin reductase-like flavin-dependent oxidoreductase (luciferase family)